MEFEEVELEGIDIPTYKDRQTRMREISEELQKNPVSMRWALEVEYNI